jgi:hypothetical protein
MVMLHNVIDADHASMVLWLVLIREDVLDQDQFALVPRDTQLTATHALLVQETKLLPTLTVDVFH